jgi:transcription termination factor Rho
MSDDLPLGAFAHVHVPIEFPSGPRLAGALELAAPLARGQRGLVIGPPRSGATTVLQWLGRALDADPADSDIIVVLIDQPIEEQLEWREAISSARVFATTSDDDVDAHVDLDAPFAAAHDAVERGRHAVMLIDSLGALARALVATSAPDEHGRVLDGGMTQAAMRELRARFAVARAHEDPNEPTITILATLHEDTALHLDEAIKHELVGTGNVEWHLSEDALRSGCFPPIDIMRSGARRTELIIGEHEADRRALLRAWVDERGIVAGTGELLIRLDTCGSLAHLMDELGL